MWLVKSLVGDRPSWHKEPINFLNKMLFIRKVRLLITSRYIAMQSYECVIISTIISFLMGAMAVLWSFLGVLKHLLAPPLRCPCLLRLKKNNNSASVFRCASCHCGWHRHTLAHPWLRPWFRQSNRDPKNYFMLQGKIPPCFSKIAPIGSINIENKTGARIEPCGSPQASGRTVLANRNTKTSLC